MFGFFLVALFCIQVAGAFLLPHHSLRVHAEKKRHRLVEQAAAGNLCNEGSLLVNRGGKADDKHDNKYTLRYRIFRPMSLSSKKAAPLVAIHGGPSLPSDYLEPLVDVIPYRSIILFDQVGCGQSDEPKNLSDYSIEYGLDDIEALLKKLGVRRFHLYGHSFGGMLAYEYAKRLAELETTDPYDDEGCLSLVLSSAPTSVSLLDFEWERLQSIIEQQADGSNPVEEQFRQQHICRTEELPEPLERAYSRAGSVWVGLDAVQGFECTPTSKQNNLPSLLIVHGEHDFCTPACIEKWDEFFGRRKRKKMLDDCSHHCLLERGNFYGETLESFFCEYD